MVILEARPPETMDALFPRLCLCPWSRIGVDSAVRTSLRLLLMVDVVIIVPVMLAVQNDGPAGGEDIVVLAQVIRPEVQAAKHGRDIQCLAIGKMHLVRSHVVDWFPLPASGKGRDDHSNMESK